MPFKVVYRLNVACRIKLTRSSGCIVVSFKKLVLARWYLIVFSEEKAYGVLPEPIGPRVLQAFGLSAQREFALTSVGKTSRFSPGQVTTVERFQRERPWAIDRGIGFSRRFEIWTRLDHRDRKVATNGPALQPISPQKRL
ncbi:MAG: hypothetical protein AB1733_06465 [Thermodesulfobacteriota bacterium]